MPLSEEPKKSLGKSPDRCPNNIFDDKEKLKKIQEELGKTEPKKPEKPKEPEKPKPEVVEWGWARSGETAKRIVKPESKPESKPKPEVAKSPDKAKLRVIPYDPKIFENSEEYYRYIVSSIASPEDIMLVMDSLMTYYSDPQNKMFPADEVVAAGFGDCENYSWLAKCLLDELGCKKNFNYNSRVIGVGKHAVCIYTDENGDTWSINQHERKKINSIYEASNLFEKEEIPVEERLYGKNIKETITLDKKLTNDYEAVIYILYDQNFDKSFNPSKILPEGWNKYKKAQLEFKNNMVVYYEEGKIHAVDDDNKNTTTFYKEGKIHSINDKNKKETDFFDEKGSLRQKTYEEGQVETGYFNSTGGLTRKNLRDGTVEIYDPKTKKIISRSFPDGDVEAEFYSSDGKVSQRDFRKNPEVKYKREWYDSAGKINQTETFDGEIEVR